MEDDLQKKWKMSSKKNGRRPKTKWKTPQKKNGRRPKKMEYDLKHNFKNQP